MRALLLIDIQNDFLPGGALPVPRGDKVIAVANSAMQRFELVVATQDWHPSNHLSFAANHPGHAIGVEGVSQILWPVHCVQNTRGAALAAGLSTNQITEVFRKGADPRYDSYSAFFDTGRRVSTGLEAFLRAKRVSELFILGLATDYCVKFTALDAQELGFRTHVIREGCRAVDLKPGDEAAAFSELRAAGVNLLDVLPPQSKP